MNINFSPAQILIGPLEFLRIGRVWAVTAFGRGLYGIGWRMTLGTDE